MQSRIIRCTILSVVLAATCSAAVAAQGEAPEIKPPQLTDAAKRSFQLVAEELRLHQDNQAIAKLMASAKANRSPYDALAAAQVRVNMLMTKEPVQTVGRAMELSRTDDQVKKAVKLIYEMGSAGDADAMYLMASFCSLGLGMTRDVSVASKWMAQAAQNGHMGAKQILEAEAKSAKPAK